MIIRDEISVSVKNKKVQVNLLPTESFIVFDDALTNEAFRDWMDNAGHEALREYIEMNRFMYDGGYDEYGI